MIFLVLVARAAREESAVEPRSPVRVSYEITAFLRCAVMLVI